MDGVIPRTKTLEDKHKEYIELIPEKEDVNVEIILRELEIKKLCADNDGIEEICTWKRQESFAFRRHGFQEPASGDSRRPAIPFCIQAKRRDKC